MATSVEKQLVRLSRELLAIGITKAQLAKDAWRGTLLQLRRGAWTEERPDDHRIAHLQKARALCQQRLDAVLSHETAAIAWGLPVDSDALARVHITSQSLGHGHHDPDVYESNTPLASHDIGVHEGLLITNVARTVIDIGRTARLEWAVAAADSALHNGLVTQCELDRAVREAARRKGIARARHVVRFANSLAESPLESISRVQLARLPIPEPVVQYPVKLNGMKVATSDFGWEQEGIVGEADGAIKYGPLLREGETPEQAVMAEKRREWKIKAAGFTVLRWGMAEALSYDKLSAIVLPEFEWRDRRPRPRTNRP